eukprot:6467889-Amphidinium_carterae.1
MPQDVIHSGKQTTRGTKIILRKVRLLSLKWAKCASRRRDSMCDSSRLMSSLQSWGVEGLEWPGSGTVDRAVEAATS